MHFGLRTTEVVSPTTETSSVHSPLSLCALLATDDPPPIILLLDTCINEASTLRASDIHLEPTDHSVRVRFRIDGILLDICTFPKALFQEVLARIKVLAHLRTDGHQAAQDGRFRITLLTNKNLDVRVSIVPTYYGENAIMRLLCEYDLPLTLQDLGFSVAQQNILTNTITKPHGMILVTGPTGSGKTSTLYTLIQLLNQKEISIITIEDPVEYAIRGITQIQTNNRSGLSFANGLRSILRQDPDVIMVGEIRDSETATIAVNTALTGHLMLSTLHTNDAASTLPRLLDMGIDAYLVASTARVIIGQRLVRTLCPYCKEEHILTTAEKNNLDSLQRRFASPFTATPDRFFQSRGCDTCMTTGYLGRIGIYEILITTPRIREAIVSRASAALIANIASEEGMTTLYEDGIAKARAGLTSLREVIRTVSIE